MMSSTRRIISAASVAERRTCRLTWNDSVIPKSSMLPTQPWYMSGGGLGGRERERESD